MNGNGYPETYSLLLGRIESGQWPPGTPILPEKELAQSLNVSRTTLRKALARLAEENHIVRRPGVGNFVGLPPSRPQPPRSLQVGIELNPLHAGSPFQERTLCACQRAGAAHGISLVLKTTEELLRGEGGDAAIFSMISEQQFDAVSVLAERMPVILFNRICSAPNVNYVAVDYRETVRRIINRIISNGTDRIAFLGGSGDSGYYASYTREAGYRQAFAAAGRSVNEGLIVGAKQLTDFSVLVDFFSRQTIDVVFLYSEKNLPMVMAALETVRHRTGGSIPLICFDDIRDVTGYPGAALSYITMPFDRMADRVMEYLAGTLLGGAGESSVREIVLPEIVIRECPYLI